MKNIPLPIRRTRTISDSESTELPDTVHTHVPINQFGTDEISFVYALFLCVAWCMISVLNNVISKSLLNNFPYPLTSTLSQLLSTAIYAYPLVSVLGIPSCNWKEISNNYIFHTILPLGIGKFLAACGTHISISRLPVSYAHTIKASMPIFVVIFSTISYKVHYGMKVYISLFVIFFGIALASITELSFNFDGMMYAVLSTAAFAFLNILTKKCLNQTHMHQFRLLLILARLSTLIFLPIWFYNDGLTFIFAKTQLSRYDTKTTIFLLVLDGFLNFSQNVIAFTLIAQITPLSYAVCNVIKRISVIVASIIIFNNPVTLLNMTGTSIAVGGVLLYNMNKAHKQSNTILPMHSHNANDKHILPSSDTSKMPLSNGFIPNYQNNHKSQSSLTPNNRLPHIISGENLYLYNSNEFCVTSYNQNNNNINNNKKPKHQFKSQNSVVSERRAHNDNAAYIDVV